jgi:hypothetical protein
LEPRPCSRFARDHLDGYIPLFRYVAARVDLAHGACADAISDDKRPELQPLLHR